MRAGALILCALALVAGAARADPVDAGAPVALNGGAPDAGSPDAGFVDVPVQLAAGQAAPFDGWELSDARARTLIENNVDLQNQLAAAKAKAAPVPGWMWLVACAGSVVVGAYCAGHDCNPLHLGK